MSYTNKQMIDLVEHAKKEKIVTHITDKSKLSIEDKVKLGLCRHFVQYAISHGYTLSEISKKTGLPVSRLSEMTNYKIKKFTVSQLLKNLELLADQDTAVKHYMDFLVLVTEAPILPVQKTKQLRRDFEKYVAAEI